MDRRPPMGGGRPFCSAAGRVTRQVEAVRRGRPGLRGHKVLQGPQGPKGVPGGNGANGANGAPGATGATGAAGSQIYSGNGAPAANLGTNGDYYLDKTNYLLYGPKTLANGWGTPTLLRGAQGAQGPAGPAGVAGSQIYSGTGAPAANLGTIGDYYLDKSNVNFYGPKTANGWGTPVSLNGGTGGQGPAGPQGAARTQGPGPQGPPGSNLDRRAQMARTARMGRLAPRAPPGATSATRRRRVQGSIAVRVNRLRLRG